MNEQFCYVEYRKLPFRGKDEKPLLVKLDDPILQTGGFCSVYQVNEEGKKWIEERGSVGGFGESGIPVWSPLLFVDFDDCPEDAEYLRGLLLHDGIAFQMFDSGNRSIHFHIAREITPSIDVPYSDKEYIRTVVPKADLSLYSAMHPFRLTGTIHEKTNRPKILIDSFDGNPLSIPIISKPDYTETKLRAASISIFEDPLVMGLSRGFREGQRYKNTLVLAYKLKERGETPGMVKGWVRNVNKLSFPPLPEERLNRIFRSVLNGSSEDE